MSSKNTNTLSLESVPNVASPVVVATEEEASRDGKGNRGYAAKDVIMGKGVELSISTDIKQSARGIV